LKKARPPRKSFEHRLPQRPSYSKTKAIQFEEFAPMIAWWTKREENEVAWKVKVGDLKRGFDLDVKNPNKQEAETLLRHNWSPSLKPHCAEASNCSENSKRRCHDERTWDNISFSDLISERKDGFEPDAPEIMGLPKIEN
jgi:hypothetical protein